MDKVLVNLNVPTIERKYNLWIESNQTIYGAIKLMIKGINELNEGYYNPQKTPLLFNKETGMMYDINLTIKEANIINGTEIILM